MGDPKGLWTPVFRSQATQNTDLQKVGVGLRQLHQTRNGWTPALLGVRFTQSDGAEKARRRSCPGLSGRPNGFAFPELEPSLPPEVHA